METRIGNYNIIKELGKGGTSTCYLVTKPPLERKILLKVLYQQFVVDKDIVARFEREARIMSRLSHPNIVQVIDFGKTENSYFIAMEFMEGKSLKELISQKKKTSKQVTDIMAELLDALAYVHKNGIIHRDIKPSNIIITEEGSPKITDFGLAWAHNLPGITQQETFIGTPEYMSVEQLKGEKIDAGTDIYSLGIVFMEMITGIKAYRGENYGEIIHSILTKKPQGLEELDANTPEETAEIIKRMIQKDKNLRYKTADEILAEIKGTPQNTVSPYKKNKLLTPVIYAVIFVFIMVFIAAIIKSYIPENTHPSARNTIAGTDSKSKTKNGKEENLIAETPAPENVEPTEYPMLIHALPYAKIYINDELVGESPPGIEVKIKSGTSKLTLKNPGFPELIKHIKPGQNGKININLVEEFSYLSVAVDPWAEVYVDDKNYGTTPIGAPIILLPGNHKMKLHNPYYKDTVESLNLKKGDTLQCKVKLKK